MNAASAMASAPDGATGAATGRSSVAVTSDASIPASSACADELVRSIGGLLVSQTQSAAQSEQSCAGLVGCAGPGLAAVGQVSPAHGGLGSASWPQHDTAALAAHAVAEHPPQGDSASVQRSGLAAQPSEPSPEQPAPWFGMKAIQNATHCGTVQWMTTHRLAMIRSSMWLAIRPDARRSRRSPAVI